MNNAAKTKLPLFSWALFDFAQSPYFSIILTFLFPAFFIHSIADTPTLGASYWGFANASAALAVAIFAPFFGAVADSTGKQKQWVAGFSFLCILSTIALALLPVQKGLIIIYLYFVFLGTFGAECAFICNNATLHSVAPKEKIGTWSGYGWSFGYLGGIFATIACYILLSISSSWIPSTELLIRACLVFTACWYLIFILPLLIFVQDTARSQRLITALREGWSQAIQTIRSCREDRSLLYFLLARLFYMDALLTLFIFWGIYAASVCGFSGKYILEVGILMQICSAIGAFLFGRLDDRIGSRRILISSTTILFICSLALIIFLSPALFLPLGVIIGFFSGSIHQSSRTWLAKTLPPERQTGLFGLFAFSGKATAFFGPLVIGLITLTTSNIRVGMSLIPLFLLIGSLLLYKSQKN